eukprot:TRINITY_DN1299_c0_g1_i1.p1 TRINITY_DN1299_c0_g1~~TRINITY_DN1299_c0_g1_i1.p1  ORF type:complete len:464 (+),score=111.60 TRINITY_DN1299_c0_g1_i1:333-1724(+)
MNDENDLLDKNLLNLLSETFVLSKDCSLSFEELASEFLLYNNHSLHKLLDSSIACDELIFSHIIKDRLMHLVEHLKVGESFYCLRINYFQFLKLLIFVFRNLKIIDRFDYGDIGKDDDELGEVQFVIETNDDFSQGIFNEKPGEKMEIEEIPSGEVTQNEQPKNKKENPTQDKEDKPEQFDQQIPTGLPQNRDKAEQPKKPSQFEEKEKLNNEEKEKIREKCNNSLTAVVSHYMFGKKVWFVAPKEFKAEKAWNRLQNTEVKHLFVDISDHIKTIDTGQRYNYEYIGKQRSRFKKTVVCSFIFLFFTVPMTDSFWKNKYVSDFVEGISKNEYFYTDFIQESETISYIESRKCNENRRTRNFEYYQENDNKRKRYMNDDPILREVGNAVCEFSSKNKVEQEVLIIYLISRLFDTTNNKDDLVKFVQELLTTSKLKQKFEVPKEKIDPLEFQFLLVSNVLTLSLV